MPGHWENDLLKGRANRSAVGALIERTWPLMLPARLPGLDSHAMCRGFACRLALLPAPLRKSLNYDQGREMARREPQRQYLPKCADLTRLSQRDLNAIVARSNNRPRKNARVDMTQNEAWAAQVKSFNVSLETWGHCPFRLVNGLDRWHA
jgi:IS30 family transposase